MQQPPTANPGVAPRTTSLIFLCCTALLCLLIILNAVYQTPLFILGINLIYKFQHWQPYAFVHFMQNLASLACHPIGVGAVLVAYYVVVRRKLLLLVHLSYFFMANFIVSLLKQAFQQSRPIWVNAEIDKIQWFCPLDFGNPSGHSFAVVLLYEPIISDCIGYDKYRFWASNLLGLAISVPISRLYLGVHSANQIFFGLALGMIFLILFKFVYQKHLYCLYWALLMKHHKRRKLIIAAFTHVLSLVIPLVFYQANLKYRPVPQPQLDNLNRVCGKDVDSEYLQGHMLATVTSISFFYGIFYGFVLLMDTPNYRKYLLGLWTHESWTKFALKLAVYVLCAGIPSGSVFLIASLVEGNAFVKYFLSSVGTLLFGLGLSYLAPILTWKWKIMKFLPGPATKYQQQLGQIS